MTFNSITHMVTPNMHGVRTPVLKDIFLGCIINMIEISTTSSKPTLNIKTQIKLTIVALSYMTTMKTLC